MHEFAKTTKDTGDCGDAYCSGHKISNWVCSCGYTFNATGYSDWKVYDDIKKINHILQAHGLGSI